MPVPGSAAAAALSALSALSAEVAYRDAGGALDAAVVVPLVLDGAVVLALPYAQRPLAEALASSSSVALTLTEPARGPAVALIGGCRVEEDRDGERFVAALLDQELRKHPPSRVLADSLMARREHWWYLPRLLVHVLPAEVVPLAPRTAASDAVLFWSSGDSVSATTVTTDDWDAEVVVVAPLDGSPPPPASASDVCLMRTVFSDDRSEHAEALVWGSLSRGAVAVSRRRGAPALPPPAGLRARLRAQRDLARACRQELARGG